MLKVHTKINVEIQLDKQGSGISSISAELQNLVDDLNLLQSSDVFAAHCFM